MKYKFIYYNGQVKEQELSDEESSHNFLLDDQGLDGIRLFQAFHLDNKLIYHEIHFISVNIN